MNDWANKRRSGDRGQSAQRRHASGRDGDLTYSPEEIYAIWNTPELRMTDNPAHATVSRQAIVDREDSDMHELLGLIVEKKAGEAMVSGDPFWGNYPPKGTVGLAADSVAVGKMPTGDEIAFPAERGTSNVGLFGATGRGKTTLLKQLLRRLAGTDTCMVTVEKKRELRHLALVPELKGRVIVLKYTELKLSLFQPPPGVSEETWATEVTKLVAGCYARQGAERLMRDILGHLLAHRESGVYPTVRDLVEAIDKFRPRFGMREAGYKESIEWVLKDLLNSTGGIFEYAWSDFLEKLFAEPGLTIIEAETLPVEHYLFLVTYIMRWLYVCRLYERERA